MPPEDSIAFICWLELRFHYIYRIELTSTTYSLTKKFQNVIQNINSVYSATYHVWHTEISCYAFFCPGENINRTHKFIKADGLTIGYRTCLGNVWGIYCQHFKVRIQISYGRLSIRKQLYKKIFIKVLFLNANYLIKVRSEELDKWNNSILLHAIVLFEKFYLFRYCLFC